MAAYPEQRQPPDDATNNVETVSEGGIEIVAETFVEDAAKRWCVIDVFIALQRHHQGNQGQLGQNDNKIIK